MYRICRPALGPPRHIEKHKIQSLLAHKLNYIILVYLKKKKKKDDSGVPIVVQGLVNLTRKHEVAGLIPGLTQWIKGPVLP